MTQEILENRLINYGVACSKLTRKLPSAKYYDAKNVTSQLIRAATSPGFHYGETRAAESTKDFLHKLKLNLKELRESYNELRYIDRMEYFQNDSAELDRLIKEASELIAIFTATVKKVQARLDRGM
ncbi:MAG: four helix bundle protein [Bacteroidota bacterium]